MRFCITGTAVIFAVWVCLCGIVLGDISLACLNGGTVATQVGNLTTCDCPAQWSGDDCSHRRCINSVNGTGPFSVRPKSNVTNTCDHCNPGYSGLACSMCSNSSQCPHGTHCNTSLIAEGTHKQLNCALLQPAFLRLLGGGREGVKGQVTLECNKSTGFNHSFPDGTCHVSFYRVEPNAFVDPYFFCTMESCRMELVQTEIRRRSAATPDSPTGSDQMEFTKAEKAFRDMGQALLYLVCVALCANGFERRHSTKRYILAYSGFIMVGVLVVYIIGVSVQMKTHLENRVEVRYLCDHTRCKCAEDSAYSPTCKDHPFGDGILPKLSKGIHLSCNNATGSCTFTIEDLQMEILLQCNGAECAQNSAGKHDKIITDAGFDAVKRTTIIALLVLFALVITVGVVLHWYWSRKVTNLRKQEFMALYSATALSIFGSPQGSPHARGRGRGGRAGGGTRDSMSMAAMEHSPQQYSALRNDSLPSEGEMRDSPPQAEALRDSTPEEPSSPEGPPVADEGEGARVSEVYSQTHSVYEANRISYDIVSYHTGEGSTTKHILQDVSLHMHSGNALALMGPSGAGKTTLLDILAMREKKGAVSGRLTINGATVAPAVLMDFKRMTGYVAQEDTLIPTLTVRQTIQYAARLKLPNGMPNQAIAELVEDVIAKLHLTQCADAMVGDEHIRGISGGEKRRVSIATELVANPRILFLDEPTSGLDSYSAQQVMEAVVNLTKQPAVPEFRAFFSFKPMVIFSIHQPSSDIYKLFDRVLLLSQGEILYIGEAARALDHVVNVTRMKPPCPTSNPAEVLLQLQHTISEQERDLLLSTCGPGGHTVLDSDDMAQVMDINEESLRYYPTVWEQFHLLCRRSFSSLIGSYYLIAAHAAAALVVGLILSFLYRHEKLDLAGTEDKAGMLTFLLLVIAFSSISILELFIAERKLFVLERENGYYGTLPYFVTKVLFDYVPLRIIPTLVLSSIIYFPMGLRTDGYQYFLWFVGICVTFSLFVTGLCLCIAMVAPSFGSGALFCSLVILWNTVFGGLMIQSQTIPIGFKYFKFGSPFYFAFEALMVNELDGLACIFDPANNEGRSAEVKVPILCRQFLYNLGLNPENFRRDIGLLCGWVLVTLVVAFLLLRFFVRLKR